MERDYLTNDFSQSSRFNVTLAVPKHESLDRKHESMERSPHYESPIRTMPEPSQEHSRQQIAVCFPLAPTITPEGNIEIISQPRAQADVPATPKILQAERQVRLAKIDHKMKAQQLCTASSQVAVATEVAVDLPGEGVYANQCCPTVIAQESTKGCIRQMRTVICDNSLAHQPHQDQHATISKGGP